MSSRYSDKVVFAYDADNNRYPVADQYNYAGGCSYRQVVRVKDKRCESLYLVDADSFTVTGTRLPPLTVEDLQSYFTPEPTEAIQTLLREGELDAVKISYFLFIHVDSVNAGPHFARCCRISKEGVITHDYDLSNKELDYDAEGEDKVEAVINALID